MASERPGCSRGFWGTCPVREYSACTRHALWWNASTRVLRSTSGGWPEPSNRPTIAAFIPLWTCKPLHPTTAQGYYGASAACILQRLVCSVPSGFTLCVQPLGHCVCVPPGGGRPRRRPASENPQVRPQRSNSAPTTPIGSLLTRACVPVCVRRCDRTWRASERWYRADGHLPRGHHHGRFHPRRPLRRPPRLLK